MSTSVLVSTESGNSRACKERGSGYYVDNTTSY